MSRRATKSGDLQHPVQAFPLHNRIAASFIEVHYNPYPKTVEMADYSFVVIPRGQLACDQQLAANDIFRDGGNDRQQSWPYNVLPNFFLA